MEVNLQPSPQKHNLQDKIVLVTGATSGIGKVTAAALASRGATVILAGRDQQKTELTADQIKSETGNQSVQYLLADYCDLEQVRTLAAAVTERFNRVDVLVNNAGAFFNTRRVTPYGVERTFLVNHLAPFLLTNLLLESLQLSPSARIVNVSSDAHNYAHMDLEDLEFKRGFSGMKAYGRSKLANIMFTYELARRLAGSQVTANALHPGHIATDIWRNNFSIIGPVLKWFMSLFALSPEEGADNSIYLASSPDVEGMTAKYFIKREPTQSSLESYDEDVAHRLWDISEDLTLISTDL
jgi:NAD(P)-dependent dehydrogenase (short-subunit alcohol dehydrogenase family)